MLQNHIQFVYSTHTDHENNEFQYDSVVSYETAVKDRSTIIEKFKPPSYEEAIKIKL